ncbi:MAG: CvpA family protein [Mangrovicoccus sp.]|nr:CvpA family protein [Mangrovicoccus sp.]
MEGFTIVDGVAGAVIVISALLAYSRGLVRELMAIAGWVAAAILAFLFAPTAEPLVKEIPFVGDFLRDSCELSIIAAFSVVFAVALIIVSVFTPLFSTLVQRSALGGVDQGLGFLFGALRGLVLVIAALIIYDRVMVSGSVPMVDNSRTAIVLSDLGDRLNEEVPDDAPGWIVERYEELVGSCNG